jgi:hypothetical protein
MIRLKYDITRDKRAAYEPQMCAVANESQGDEMATDTWTGVYGGNWSDPTGWSGGTVPAAGDTVQLSQALNGPYTVHLDANEGAYAALTVSAANATLALYDGGLMLSVTGATTLSAGDIAIAGNATLDTGTFAESGGFLGMSDGTLDVSGQATLSGGGLGVYGGAFDAGSLAFAGGSFGISGGDVSVTNQVSETAGTAGFYAGTFDAGSLAVSGGSLGMSGGAIDSSGALTLSGTGSIGLYNTAATLEAGSLSQTGGSLGMSGGTLRSPARLASPAAPTCSTAAPLLTPARCRSDRATPRRPSR